LEGALEAFEAFVLVALGLVDLGGGVVAPGESIGGKLELGADGAEPFVSSRNWNGLSSSPEVGGGASINWD